MLISYRVRPHDEKHFLLLSKERQCLLRCIVFQVLPGVALSITSFPEGTSKFTSAANTPLLVEKV
jgi:hypothetical protein